MANQKHAEFYRALGDLIRKYRERPDNGMTQEELGRRVGLSRVSIVNVEKGRQHLAVHQLYAFAKALSVEPEALMPSPTDGSGWIAEKLPAGTDQSIAQWAKKLT